MKPLSNGVSYLEPTEMYEISSQFFRSDAVIRRVNIEPPVVTFISAALENAIAIHGMALLKVTIKCSILSCVITTF